MFNSTLHSGRAALLAVLLAVAGCATVERPALDNMATAEPAVRDCARWFDDLDGAVDRAGVRDAGATRVAGFPYLRTDRFLAAAGEKARASDAAFDDWVRRLRAHDAAARRAEISNLPRAELETLGAKGAEQAFTRTATCAGVLAKFDLQREANRAWLVERAQVPDDYLDWQRAVGLYAFTRIPFARGVEQWHGEALEMFRKAAAGEGAGHKLNRYTPPAGTMLSREAVASLIARRAAENPLGIPEFTAEEQKALFDTFAPAYEVEATGDFDRIGRLHWRDDAAPSVDTGQPVTYRRLAFTKYQGQALAQLVYTIWFSERPHDSPSDMLAGKLDGLVIRVTLGRDGAPLVYDTIHPCGCFHMFLPTARVTPLPPPEEGIEWAFIPAAAPELAHGQRLRVRMATRTHYLLGLFADNGAPGTTYSFVDDEELRTLPAPGGVTRSAFGTDGIVPGTERGERMLFWPMGIPNAGAMRQWGKHATAFLGRRHFDDADLIERRFRILDVTATASSK